MQQIELFGLSLPILFYPIGMVEIAMLNIELDVVTNIVQSATDCLTRRIVSTRLDNIGSQLPCVDAKSRTCQLLSPILLFCYGYGYGPVGLSHNPPQYCSRSIRRGPDPEKVAEVLEEQRPLNLLHFKKCIISNILLFSKCCLYN